MGTLYELTDDLLQLQMYLEEDDEDQALRDTLEMISQNFEDKIDDYCHVLANYDADEEALTTEIKRLTERRESVRRAKERMKDAMQSAMLLTNKPKIKTVAYTVYLRKSETVEVPNPEKLPKELQKVEIKADKTEIKKILKENPDALAGIATLEEHQSLIVR